VPPSGRSDRREPAVIDRFAGSFRHHRGVSGRGQGGKRGTPTPGELGLPEHSALTVEGRIERASMVGTHLARRRYRHERPIWKSSWAQGLWLMMAAIGLVIVVLLVLSWLT
jgi:hypothetical protein